MSSQTNRIRAERRPMTVRAARWSADHPWRAIGIWLLFVVVCIGAGQAFSLKQVNDRDTTVGQSHQAQVAVHDAGLADPVVENVLISGIDQSAGQQAAIELTDKMKTLPDVASVAAPVKSSRNQAILVAVTMRGDPDQAADHVQPLLDTTAAVQHDFPALKVEQAGGASSNKQVNELVAQDLSSAAIISLPVTLIILLIAFGAIVAAGVPVLLALSAVGAASGLSVIASQFLPDSGSTSSMILLIGMAVGVDYSLFYVKRMREEQAGFNGLRASGSSEPRSKHHAIEIAAETSGHSVVVSGMAVLISMVGLYLVHDAVFSSLATGSIIVVAIAVLGSLTVLPALLSKLGRAIDRPRVPLLWRLTAQTRTPKVWPTLLRPSLNRPGRTFLVSAGALVLLALPALTLKLHSDSAASLPKSLSVVGTMHRLEEAFPGSQVSDQLVVVGTPDEAPQIENALRGVSDKLVDNTLFSTEQTPQVTASQDGTVHLISLDVPYDAESRQAKAGVSYLRNQLVPELKSQAPQAKWLVGGEVAQNTDYDQHLSDRLPWVVLFVVGLTMLIMVATMRSVVLAVLTAFMNLLSAGAAFGVLVLVFQHSLFEKLLGFQSTGAVINWIPLFTFAVLFGLSMDYHIFLLSRVREAAQAGMSPRDAVRHGVVSSAGTITSAAIVMVSVFSIFAALHMIEMKELGVGLAAAVLIDALVVRTVLLPSALVLLGRFAWWPGRLSRVRRPEPMTAPAAPVLVDAVLIPPIR